MELMLNYHYPMSTEMEVKRYARVIVVLQLKIGFLQKFLLKFF